VRALLADETAMEIVSFPTAETAPAGVLRLASHYT